MRCHRHDLTISPVVEVDANKNANEWTGLSLRTKKILYVVKLGGLGNLDSSHECFQEEIEANKER